MQGGCLGPTGLAGKPPPSGGGGDVAAETEQFGSPAAHFGELWGPPQNSKKYNNNGILK